MQQKINTLVTTTKAIFTLAEVEKELKRLTYNRPSASVFSSIHSIMEELNRVSNYTSRVLTEDREEVCGG